MKEPTHAKQQQQQLDNGTSDKSTSAQQLQTQNQQLKTQTKQQNNEIASLEYEHMVGIDNDDSICDGNDILMTTADNGSCKDIEMIDGSCKDNDNKIDIYIDYEPPRQICEFKFSFDFMIKAIKLLN